MENLQSKSNKILFIDVATSGIAGCYADKYFNALNTDSNIEVVVSYYFPYNYGYKFFYRYSDLAASNKLHKFELLRLAIRLIEMFIGFTLIVKLMYRSKYDKVIYALSTNLKIEYFFLFFIKNIFKINLYIIAHDVIPFVFSFENLNKKIKQRKKFFLLSDKIIIHNNSSLADLIKIYSINEDKILTLKFPLYNLDQKLIYNEKITDYIDSKYLLFIGHLREEKGVDFLLEVWKSVVHVNKDFKLVIAGRIPRGSKMSITDFEIENVVFLNKYVNDITFKSLIDNSAAVLLPYKRATNSAVLYSILTRIKPVILSDIPVFNENLLIDKSLMFRNLDHEDFFQKILFFFSLKNDDKESLKITLTNKILAYDKSFNIELNSMLNKK